jgi:hypothetical protein
MKRIVTSANEILVIRVDFPHRHCAYAEERRLAIIPTLDQSASRDARFRGSHHQRMKPLR